MGRPEDERLANGDLAISEAEAHWFFSRLRFDIAGYQARVTTNAGAEAKQLVRNVSSTAEFVGCIEDSEDVRMERLEGGSLCCVYPLKISAAVPTETVEWPLASALMIEIRASCRASENDEPIATASRAGDRSALLEELALRVSSDIFTHPVTSNNRLPFSAGIEPTAPALPRRMFQELILTRPIVDVSTRILPLPPSFGTDAALVELSIRTLIHETQNDPSIEMSLVDVTIEARDWYVQRIGDPPLPFVLANEACWQVVYRISSLARGIKDDPLFGLNLLNSNSANECLVARATVSGVASPSTGDSDKASTDEPQVFSVAHYFHAVSTDQQQTQQSQQHSTYGTSAPRLGSGPGSFESTTASSSGATPVPLASYTDSSLAVLGGHGKAASVDHTAIRKHSLALPSYTTQQPVSNSQRPVSMLKMPPRNRGDLSLTSPDGSRHAPWNDQRSRAATINALSLAPRPSIVYPRASISTIHSTVSSSTNNHYQGINSGPIASHELHGFEPRQDSLVKRKPSMALSLSSHPPQTQGPGAQIGSLQLSFEAPPKVCLGQELTVRVYVTNNTNTRYFRLCLVDVSSDIGSSDTSDSANDADGAPRGLISLNHTTDVPPLRPGESTFVALQYIAAAPYFHAIRLLRLLNLDSDHADKALVTIETPFVVYVDD
ncbi:hypothetical protein GGI15_000752 [Coemansia interrupta]|uniref:TRAPP trafficking subunit Trs65-domain-containing protein n=1 Tax=Coemansia interrupta TaxID=1126814 RepID=A0A9W8LN69_9FUNG|nr:hypothetical protein GGI15_000752 [Coemansia interrupta]